MKSHQLSCYLLDHLVKIVLLIIPHENLFRYDLDLVKKAEEFIEKSHCTLQITNLSVMLII